MTPEIKIINLTPAQAKAWLGKNDSNRPIRPGKVSSYARDMAAGRWQLTGEPIKHDHTGRLIDGQHRCAAVVRSGITIRTAVVTGLDREAQVVMDSGAPRKDSDALAMKGFAYSSALAAAIRGVMAWENGLLVDAGSRGTGTGTALTRTEVVAYAEAHPGLAAMMPRIQQLRKAIRVSTGSLAVAVVETARIDFDDSAEFFRRIADTELYGKGDPVTTLVRRLNDEALARSRAQLPLGAGVYFMFRAWNAYRTGEKLTLMRLGSEGRWNAIPTPV